MGQYIAICIYTCMRTHMGSKHLAIFSSAVCGRDVLLATARSRRQPLHDGLDITSTWVL